MIERELLTTTSVRILGVPRDRQRLKAESQWPPTTLTGSPQMGKITRSARRVADRCIYLTILRDRGCRWYSRPARRGQHEDYKSLQPLRENYVDHSSRSVGSGAFQSPPVRSMPATSQHDVIVGYGFCSPRCTESHPLIILGGYSSNF